jgi:hypothetical protein
MYTWQWDPHVLYDDSAMPLNLSRDIIARWGSFDPAHAPLLKEASIDGVILESANETVERACAQLGIKTAPAADFQFLPLEGLEGARSDAPVVLTTGLWPGISKGPNVRGRGDETASASREPWVDANGYLAAYLRALYPSRPAVLGYLPDEKAGLESDRMVPFDTLELALVEAWVSGGNYILALEPRYREALVRGDAKALEAWRQLGKTASWLKENANLFGQPVLPTVTALVELGEPTAEIANLLFRRNVSPALANAANPPPPDPRNLLALEAASIRRPKPEVGARILAHAEAGATVITDAPARIFPDAWWRRPGLKLIKSQHDRDFYALGRGRLVAYKEEIVDVSEFALDVIDLITHRRRAARLWNAPAVIPLATSGPKAGALLHVVNYGSPRDDETQARVRGNYSSARVLRPESPPVPLRTYSRGETTEVIIPEFRRLAVVVFG